MHLTPSRIYTALVRRLHFLVLLGLIVPCYCLIATFGMNEEDAALSCSHLLPLYALTLTLALPASFMYLLQEKVKNLGTYLLCVLPASFLYLWALCSFEMSSGLSVQGAEQVPQALILVLYLCDAIRMRTNDNSRKKALAQEDLSWGGDVYLLPLPALLLVLPFAVIYVCALFFHSNEIAQIALIGAIVYFFLVLPCHILTAREEYLDGRHHISRVPIRQIAALQGAALLRVLLPCALLAAAALMTSGERHFLNLPELHLEYGNTDPYGGYYEPNYILRRLMELGLIEKGTPPPAWLVSLLNFLENVLALFMTAVLVWALWLIVKSLYLRFRKITEENTVSRSVGESQDEHTSLKKKSVRLHSKESREDRGIRRRYRRVIIQHRHEAPAPYETPAVMEQLAGLPDTPDMRELHNQYEKTRYGQKKTE